MDNPVLPASALCLGTKDPSLSLALESPHNQLSEAALQISFNLLCASSHTQSFFLFFMLLSIKVSEGQRSLHDCWKWSAFAEISLNVPYNALLKWQVLQEQNALLTRVSKLWVLLTQSIYTVFQRGEKVLMPLPANLPVFCWSWQKKRIARTLWNPESHWYFITLPYWQVYFIFANGGRLEI